VNELVPLLSSALPELVAVAGERASVRFLEFFAANIRNPHTRRAYARAADEFLAWCAAAGVPRSAPSSPCMSPPGSRPRRASSRRRASSNGLLRSVIYSTGWSPARSCRSTRPRQCVGPGRIIETHIAMRGRVFPLPSSPAEFDACDPISQVAVRVDEQLIF